MCHQHHFCRSAADRFRPRNHDRHYAWNWGRKSDCLSVQAEKRYCWESSPCCSLLFAADLINQTDYRFWSFDIRSFPLKKIWVAIRYIPLYVSYYIVQSIAVKRSTFRKQSELIQILTRGLFNMLAPAIMLIITYAPTPLLQATTWVALFSKVGIAMVASVFALIPILLLPIVPIMFITAAIAVRSYRLTGNLYIAAIVNTLLIVMITVANTSFSFPY